jgi:hypothetical protein
VAFVAFFIYKSRQHGNYGWEGELKKKQRKEEEEEEKDTEEGSGLTRRKEEKNKMNRKTTD